MIRELVDGAAYLFSNEYESHLIESKTGWSAEDDPRPGRHPGDHPRCRTVCGSSSHGAPTPSRCPPSAASTAVEPTGVGDAFRSGFLAALDWGLSHERAAAGRLRAGGVRRRAGRHPGVLVHPGRSSSAVSPAPTARRRRPRSRRTCSVRPTSRHSLTVSGSLGTALSRVKPPATRRASRRSRVVGFLCHQLAQWSTRYVVSTNERARPWVCESSATRGIGARAWVVASHWAACRRCCPVAQRLLHRAAGPDQATRAAGRVHEARPTTSTRCGCGRWLAAIVTGVVVWGLILYAAVRFRRRSDTEVPVQTRYNLPIEVLLHDRAGDDGRGLLLLHRQGAEPRRPRRRRTPPTPSRSSGSSGRGRSTTTSATTRRTRSTSPSVARPSSRPAPRPSGPRCGWSRTSPCSVYLHSPDVIHSFWVPAFLFKMDDVPGRHNHFALHPDAGRHVRGPLRRALRRLPLPDAVQRQGRRRGGLRRPPPAARRRGQHRTGARQR